jgi:hypothetical protein
LNLLTKEIIMRPRWFFPVVMVPVMAACAGFVFLASSQAQGQPGKGQPGKKPDKSPPDKAEHDKIQAAIKSKGKLPGGAAYWKMAETLRGGKRQTIAAVPLNVKVGAAKGGNAALTGSRSSFTIVGGEGLPKGFGTGFTWDRGDEEALLVMFINAADPLGVSIDGLKAGDQVQVLSASGIASYSEDKGNPTASSIVGLVAKGANIALGAAGAPEVVPLVNAAEQFAREQFKATNAKTKRRDAFGVDPGSGHKARQEGGLLVCLPEAGGIFYSGDGSHKDRWIKSDGVRADKNLPTHVFGSFFPMQGLGSHNTRTVQQDGQAYVTAWDWKFDDNAGFYKVFVKLRKGNGLPPPTILKGTTPKLKN